MDSGSASLTKKMENFLKENGFGPNTFKNSPNWVKIWVNYVLWNIENEIWNISVVLEDKSLALYNLYK